MRFHCLRFSLLNLPSRNGWHSSCLTSTRVSSRECARAVISMRGRFGPRAYPVWPGDCPSSGLPATFSPQAGRRDSRHPLSPLSPPAGRGLG
ncbi:hypothetical protein SF83666_b50310 (plasmid) [Sinorhizobium fredii CCBAU 83666]|nr:hypothetical protein SF83666_b50310 [Sinorhizobium fredii CCBAU 83666]